MRSRVRPKVEGNNNTYEGGDRFEPWWAGFWAEPSPLGLLLEVLFDLPTGVIDDEAAAREDAALAAA